MFHQGCLLSWAPIGIYTQLRPEMERSIPKEKIVFSLYRYSKVMTPRAIQRARSCRKWNNVAMYVQELSGLHFLILIVSKSDPASCE